MSTRWDLKNPEHLVEKYIEVHNITDEKTKESLKEIAKIINTHYALIPK